MKMRIATMGDASQSVAFVAALWEFKLHHHEVADFRPDGQGREMELQIRNGEFDAAFDFTPVELLSGLAGQDRLTAASLMQLPQLISICGLDYHPVELRPTTPKERDLLGKVLVERACASNAPVVIALPAIKQPNDPLIESIRNWAYPPSLLWESSFELNTAEFGVECAKKLLTMLPRVS